MIKNWLLDLLAKFYYFIWYKGAQRNEPWTPQMCRIEQKWPEFVWGVTLSLFGLMGVWIADGTIWQKIVGIAVFLFYWWFIHHCIDYIKNNPNNQPHLFIWAKARLIAIGYLCN